MRRGRFITVEGGEGAGKSTQIARVIEKLRGAGVRVVATREPGGTPFAEEVRGLILATRAEAVDPIAELFLMFAARAQHVAALIEPALARGDWVVCDRFSDATLAYQGAGRGLDAQRIGTIDAMARSGLLPDLTLLLDIPVDRGLARVGRRGAHDRFEREGPGFHQRVRDGYLEIARREPARVSVVDASRTEDEVAASIGLILAEFLRNAGVS